MFSTMCEVDSPQRSHTPAYFLKNFTPAKTQSTVGFMYDSKDLIA